MSAPSRPIGEGEVEEKVVQSGSVAPPVRGRKALARRAELTVERVDLDHGAKFGEIDGVDDVAIGGDLIQMFRLERMDKGHFWGKVYFRDGRSLRFSFWTSKRSRLQVGAEWEGRATSERAAKVDGAGSRDVQPSIPNPPVSDG